jgi:hypothetical protein
MRGMAAGLARAFGDGKGGLYFAADLRGAARQRYRISELPDLNNFC